MKPMMKCGHAANAVDKDGHQCCAICAGYTPDALIEAGIGDVTEWKERAEKAEKDQKPKRLARGRL